MTGEQKTELLEQVYAAVKEIEKQLSRNVIRGFKIPTLVNMKTGKSVGFIVELQLSGRYDYDEQMINAWKDKLKADEWYIKFNCNRLFIIFKVRFKKAKN